MDGFQPPGIYVLAMLLYTVPCGFLCAAWRRAIKAGLEELHPVSRASCLKSSFIAATCATALSLIFLFSYLHNGGGIHGSRTSPGLWTSLGLISTGTSAASLLLAAIGRGKGKLLLIGWLLGVFAAECVIFQVAVD